MAEWTQSEDGPDGSWHYTWFPEEEYKFAMRVHPGTRDCEVRFMTPEPARWNRTVSYNTVEEASRGATEMWENFTKVRDENSSARSDVLDMLNKGMAPKGKTPKEV